MVYKWLCDLAGNSAWKILCSNALPNDIYIGSQFGQLMLKRADIIYRHSPSEAGKKADSHDQSEASRLVRYHIIGQVNDMSAMTPFLLEQPYWTDI